MSAFAATTSHHPAIRRNSRAARLVTKNALHVRLKALARKAGRKLQVVTDEAIGEYLARMEAKS